MVTFVFRIDDSEENYGKMAVYLPIPPKAKRQERYGRPKMFITELKAIISWKKWTFLGRLQNLSDDPKQWSG